MITVKQIAHHIVPTILLPENKNVTLRTDSVRMGARTIRMATRACSLVILIAMTTEQKLLYKQASPFVHKIMGNVCTNVRRVSTPLTVANHVSQLV